MKNLRLFVFSTGGLFLATSGLVVACGDDTIVNVGVDGSVPDGSSDAPVTPTDSGADVTNKPDVVTDIDAGLTLTGYKATVAATLCQTLAKCCYGANGGVPDSGAVDGGTFNTTQCLNVYNALGFESSNVGAKFAVEGGKVKLDQAKAVDCLAKVGALSCNLGFAELAAARTACFGALAGQQAAGQPCQDTIECATGLYCDPTGDAGAGTCTALATSGQSCNVIDTGAIEDDAITNDVACSWRGSGTPPLHCDTFDFGAPLDFRPRADWKCAPAVKNGEFCLQTTWCENGICDPTDSKCRTPVQYFTTKVCDFYTK